MLLLLGFGFLIPQTSIARSCAAFTQQIIVSCEEGVCQGFQLVRGNYFANGCEEIADIVTLDEKAYRFLDLLQESRQSPLGPRVSKIRIECEYLTDANLEECANRSSVTQIANASNIESYRLQLSRAHDAQWLWTKIRYWLLFAVQVWVCLFPLLLILCSSYFRRRAFYVLATATPVQILFLLYNQTKFGVYWKPSEALIFLTFIPDALLITSAIVGIGSCLRMWTQSRKPLEDKPSGEVAEKPVGR